MEELKEILSQQHIKLDFEIPKDVKEMHFLQVKNKVFSIYNKITKQIEQPIDRNNMESILKDSINNFDEYEFNSIESSTTNYFIYNQVDDKIPFFGARIEVYINEEGDISYTQNYFEVMNQGLDKQIISSYSALRTVLDQQLIPNGAEIERIILGYHGQAYQSSIQVLTPVWKLIYQLENEIDHIYVNALTGAIENVISY